MNHKISEFCDKIDSVKKMSDRLRQMKYGPLGASKTEINSMIEVIQADCLLLAKDKGEYVKNEKHNFDYSGVDHDDSMFINKEE